MKIFPLTVAILLQLVTVDVSSCISADGAADGLSKQPSVLVETNALKSTIGGLSNLEKLWPENSRLYFQSVQQAASVLGKSPESAEAVRALLNLFTNVIQKPFPKNTQQAAAISELKRDVFLNFMNYDKIKNEKVAWLSTAKYLGAIRSLIIPNYQNRGIAAPGYGILLEAGVHSPEELADPKLKQEYDKVMKDRDEDLAMNELQLSLRTSDNIISFFLLNECTRRFPVSNPTNQEFIQSIISSAHLTADEQHQLQ